MKKDELRDCRQAGSEKDGGKYEVCLCIVAYAIRLLLGHSLDVLDPGLGCLELMRHAYVWHARSGAGQNLAEGRAELC